MNDRGNEIIAWISFALALVASFFAAARADDLKREAVERGFAEWVSDSSGNTTWQWREAK